MMKKLLIIFACIFSVNIYAQTISTDPALPTAQEVVTVTFDATGTGLEGYTGDVYAHTGVSIDGDRWKYVIESWGNNETQPKLTRLETDLYELVITPSIQEFYSVPANEHITELCFVFRGAEGSPQSADLFTNVYDASLSVNIINPANDILVVAGEQIDIEVGANYSNLITLYVDDEEIASSTTGTINKTITAATEGKHWIWVKADDDTESVYDSVSYYVRDEVVVADLPSGVKKGINYIDDETVTLVLHAPNKEYVYLIGDFNNWDVSITTEIDASIPQQVTATTWLMNKTSDGEHFWLTLENVVPQDEYAYQYYIDGEIVVADPYTEKVLDPWNDGYITDAVYPNLKEYPHGKTTEPVSVFQTAQGDFVWEVEDFEAPAVTDMVVYEMLIRDFVEAHSYAAIADTLDYLINLGVNVLELMPVNEFEGNSSWGYNPSFYFAPDKYYGPKDELKKLIDECHKRGIAVVIDMVLNHSFGQSPLVRMYADNGVVTADNPWYNVASPNQTYHWGYDFNHERQVVKEFVDSVNSFWIDEYKVDGFRFDFTKGFTQTPGDGWAYDASRIAILKRMADEIWKRDPDNYVIFEHLADNSEEKELANHGILLWGNINHNYCEGAMGWTENGKSDVAWISYQERGWNEPNVVGYMESHDEERMMYKNITWGNVEGSYNLKDTLTALTRVELSAAFFLTIPGPKMIWQFGELGYDYSIDFNGRVGEKPIRWDYFDVPQRKRVYDVFAALAKIKTEEPAFETNDFDLDVYSGVKRIHLNHSDMNVVVLGNFEMTAQTINPEFQQTGKWYEYFTGDSIEVSDVNATLTFAQGEYRLYTTKRLAKPEITLSHKQLASKDTDLQVYPNPVSSYLNVSIDAAKIDIYNIYGQHVASKELSSKSVNVANLDAGIYIISVTDNKGIIHSSRFVKN